VSLTSGVVTQPDTLNTPAKMDIQMSKRYILAPIPTV
jgi:hypothetical protein